MNSLIRADIFFFVSTISIATITVLFIILFIYLVKILANIRYISSKAKEETDLVSEEIRLFFQRIKLGKSGIMGLIGIFLKVFNRYRHK